MPLTVHLRPDDLRADDLRPTLSPDVVLSDAVDASIDVLVDGEPGEDVLDALPRLRALVVPYAGLSGRTRKRLLRRPEVVVYNLHHNATIVAELVVGLLLAAAKGIHVADRRLRAGDWTLRYQEDRSPLLAGKSALIVGYGAIGRETAVRLRAFGMRVVGIRRGASEWDGDVEVRSTDDLLRSLREANVVVVAVPKTPATTGMIGAEELAALPTDAILVNVARGPVVEEQALFEALRSKRLYGAGLDVWYQYPFEEEARTHTLPSKLPFHELDNVVLSPHRGGACAETEALRQRHLVELLNRLAADDPPATRVDVEAGY